MKARESLVVICKNLLTHGRSMVFDLRKCRQRREERVKLRRGELARKMKWLLVANAALRGFLVDFNRLNPALATKVR